MSRTAESLLRAAQRALHDAELTRPDWTWAAIHSARSVGGPISRRTVGVLGWDQWQANFVEVDRGVRETLAQHGFTLQAGLSAVFLARAVVNRRFGFQVELFDVLVETIDTASSSEHLQVNRSRTLGERWRGG